MIGFILAKRRSTPLCAPAFVKSAASALDARLMGGAIIFGIGWGLAGYCPGPALAALSFVGENAWLFVAAMLIGMTAFSIVFESTKK